MTIQEVRTDAGFEFKSCVYLHECGDERAQYWLHPNGNFVIVAPNGRWKVSLKHEIRKEGYYEMLWKVRSGKLLTTLAKLVGAAK